MTSDRLHLYTAQTQVVIDAIKRDGRSCVKREYIERKYGSEAWVFQQAYSFFAQNAPRYVEQPADAESGIWCFSDWRWAVAGTGCQVIELSVPRECAVLFFDLRIWNRMLNLEYIGSDAADDEAFRKRISNMGMRSPSEAFSTSFYPTVKREILQSWQRLFGSADTCPDSYVQAGLWELREEWVLSIRAGG